METSHKQANIENTEIERKFLLNGTPSEIKNAPKMIAQGYVALDPNGCEVRLRKKSNRFFLTAKSGGDLERVEAEIEIKQDQFDKLWLLTEGRRIEKSRYEINAGGVVVEVDVYQGTLTGLVTAEVEFPSIEISSHFVPPDWLGVEVTKDARYKNKNLACFGVPPPAGN